MNIIEPRKTESEPVLCSRVVLDHVVCQVPKADLGQTEPLELIVTQLLPAILGNRCGHTQ